MKQQALRTTLAALALAATLTASGCGGSDQAGGMGGMDHGSATPTMSSMPSTDASPSTSTSPNPSTSTSPSTAAQFNPADVMFVQMMLPHHQQAVAMSDTLLGKSGISARTTALARQIKRAQAPEITTMKRWQKAWGQPPADDSMGGMHHGGASDGMATKGAMRRLDKANGAAAERRYLQMMSAHHTGAITMAQAEIKNGQNRDAVQLAKNIAGSQQKEIATMKELLAQL